MIGEEQGITMALGAEKLGGQPACTCSCLWLSHTRCLLLGTDTSHSTPGLKALRNPSS